MKVIAADLGMKLTDSDEYVEYMKKDAFTFDEAKLAWNRAISISNAFADEAKELLLKKRKDSQSDSRGGQK